MVFRFRLYTAVAGLALLALPTASTAQSRSAPDSTRASQMARADLARIRGADTAAVWIVVISDFQCSFCKRWHEETAPRIIEQYVQTGKARIAYLNYPIRSHRNAQPAHELAMCAAEQGSFWPVADAIFARQGGWNVRGDASFYFDSLARTLPLDQTRLRRCLDTGAMRPLIQADYDRAVRLGVGSTPTILVGDRVIIGAQPFEVFAAALNSALARAPNAP